MTKTGRPPVAVGWISEPWGGRQLGNGAWTARVRFRAADGNMKTASGRGDTLESAGRAARQSAVDQLGAVGPGKLTSDSTVAELAAHFLDEQLLLKKIKPQSLTQYEIAVRLHIKPAIGGLAIKQLTVPVVDHFLKSSISRSGHGQAKRNRSVLSGMVVAAVRGGLLPMNVVRDAVKVEVRREQPKALSRSEVQSIREALANYRVDNSKGRLNGPKSDGLITQVVEVMLGSSLRPGEVLGLRRRDVELGADPRLTVAGTIVTVLGQTYRQDDTKGKKRARTISLPSYSVQALKDRLARTGELDPDALIFSTRDGNVMAVSVFGARWRRFRLSNMDLDLPDFESLTPYVMRKTVATTIAEAAGAELASKTLGHSSVSTTNQHYIMPSDRVNPMTASILDATFGNTDAALARIIETAPKVADVQPSV